MTQGGGGGSIPLSRLVSRVEVDLGNSTQNLQAHRNELKSTSDATKQLGNDAGSGLAHGMGSASTSVKQLNEDLKGQRQILEELQRLQKSAGGVGATPSISAAIRETEGNVAALESQIRKLGSESQSAGRQAQQSFAATSSSVQELRQHLESLTQIQQRGAQQGIFTPGLQQEINRTSAALRTVDQAQNGAAQSARQLGSAQSELGSEVGKTGSGFQNATEHILRYAVAYEGLRVARRVVTDLVEATVGLQTEMVKTVALTDVQAGSIGKATQEIGAISRDTGVAARDLGAAYYYIASSGVQAADSSKILEASAKAAAAGLGETKIVADTVTSTLNAYKLSADQSGRVTDVLVQAVKQGKGEASEFAGSLGRVLPIAAASGISIEQVAASMAVMTRTGLNANEAATALRATIGNLEAPSKETQKALSDMGLSADGLRAMIREKGLAAALQELMVRSQGNVSVLDQLIPNIRALTGVLSTAGSQSEAYTQVLEAMNTAQGSTDKAFQTTGQSVEFQSRRVRAAFESMAIGANSALPDVAAFLGGFADGVNESSKRAQEMQTTADQGFAAWKKGLGDAIEENTRFRDTAGPVPAKLKETTAAADDTAKGMQLMGKTFGAMLTESLQPLMRGIGVYIQLLELAAGAQAKFNAIPKPHLNETQYNAQFGPQPTPVEGKETDYRSRPIPEGYDQNLLDLGITKPSIAEQTAQIDYEGLRRQAQGMAVVSSEARKLQEIMGELWKLPGGADPKIIEDKLRSLAQAEATQEQAWRRSFNPEEADRRIGHLKALTDEYTQAYIHGTAEQVASAQERVSSFLREQGAADTAAASQRKKDQEDRAATAETKRQQAERDQAARAAHEADPLAGIREGLNRDRGDLVGTAGQVMADIENAVKLRGEQGARAAGESFANQARRWGEELEKAGLPGWEDAFKHLIAQGEVAVLTGSPDMLRAIHDTLAEGARQVKESNIFRAVEEETARANTTLLTGQLRINDQLAQAEQQAGDSRAALLQQEVDREYDIWARRQIDRLTEADKNERDLQRIKEDWGRQDDDRQEQQARARTDRQDNAQRAEQDRARTNARTLAEIQEGIARSAGDTTRARAREDREAEAQHNQRLRQITTQGGPDVSRNLAQENANYKEQLDERARRRSDDDAEAAIKRSQQVADAQKRIAEQNTDAQIRAGQQTADLAKRQGEQNDDLTKTRARQLQARVSAQEDSEWLRGRRITHEQEFYVSAEQQALTKFKNDVARIDARYQHEEAKAAETSEQIQLKRQRDIDAAAIKANAKEGFITPDQATTQLTDLDEEFIRKSAGLTSGLRQRDAEIEAQLRDSIARSKQQAPGFAASQSAPFIQPFTPGVRTSSIPDSLFAAQNALRSVLPFQLPSPPAPGPLEVVLPDEQIQDFIDGVSNIPPMEMNDEVLETEASRIRRNRSRARAIG